MRFTEVWGETLKQNRFLKSLSIFLVFATISTGVAAYKLADKTPLVIERGCYSRAVVPKAVDVTPHELEEFLTEAMSYRFDSESNPIREFFSDEEFQSVKLERDEFVKKGMSQMILIHPQSIVTQGNKVRFNTERIIMVGTVRSTIPFALEATIQIIPRSQANPYGIQIERLRDILPESLKDLKKDVAN